MGFEPMRAEHNRLAVYRLNHSATSSYEWHQLFNRAQVQGLPLVGRLVNMMTVSTSGELLISSSSSSSPSVIAVSYKWEGKYH